MGHEGWGIGHRVFGMRELEWRLWSGGVLDEVIGVTGVVGIWWLRIL